MNSIQKHLLQLADTVNLGELTYYRLAKDLKIDHPYKVKFAIEQLVKNGFLLRNLQTGTITKPNKEDDTKGLVNIPYYGEVNCGEALMLATDEIRGYLKISPSVLKISDYKDIFALKASGSSMNKASISGKPVNDGDYVIVKRGNDFKNGDYVVSVIGGAANLKHFFKDNANKRILLLSQSVDDFPPIVISENDIEDLSSYEPVAKAVDVVSMRV